MAHKFFRSIAFIGVAAFTVGFGRVFTIEVADADPVGAQTTSPARFWSELPDPSHVAKVQTMPDFVEVAAKLSPAVVNISTDEPAEPAEVVEPPQNPEGIEPPKDHEVPRHSRRPSQE